MQKRAARESDEIRENDKKSSLKSKTAARMAADFKAKERCAKKLQENLMRSGKMIRNHN